MKAQDVETVLKALLLKDLRIQCRARGLSPAGGKEALIERLKDEMLRSNDYTLKTVEGTVDRQLTENIMGKAAMRETHLVNNYHRPEGQNVGNFITDRTSSRVLAPPGGGSQVSLSMDTPAAPNVVKVEVPSHPAAPPTPQFVAPPVAKVPVHKPVALVPKLAPAPASTPAPAPVPAPASATPTPPPSETPPSESEPAQSPPPKQHSGLVAPYGVSDDSGKVVTNNYARPGGMQNVGNFITERSTSRVIAPPGGTSHVSLG